ncbi:hypothetical protein N9R54_04860, partial [Pelobium sp.]
THPIKIGHIGSAGKRKNVDILYNISEKINFLIKKNLIQLSVIGVLEESIKPYMNDFVINFVDNKVNTPIDRKYYDSQLSNLDYAIFFYGENDFLLRSSAAFFDAIIYEKPIIALNNTFFEKLFLLNGDMGYLCDNKNQLIKVIEDISNLDSTTLLKYSEFVKNIQLLKKSLDLKNIADDLNHQLKALHII